MPTLLVIVPRDKYSCVEFKSDSEGAATATSANAKYETGRYGGAFDLKISGTCMAGR